jgi:hypothetical protein
MSELDEYIENFDRLKEELTRELEHIKGKDPTTHKKV